MASLLLLLSPGALVIRTHDRPNNPYIPLFVHTVLRPVLTRMITCFHFDYMYFVPFNLHLIGRKVNLQALIFKRAKYDKRHFGSCLFDIFVQFGEFVQVDVACPMKPKQTRKHIPCRRLLLSEARSINLERRGHRSGRNPRKDGP